MLGHSLTPAAGWELLSLLTQQCERFVTLQINVCNQISAKIPSVNKPTGK